MGYAAQQQYRGPKHGPPPPPESPAARIQAQLEQGEEARRLVTQLTSENLRLRQQVEPLIAELEQCRRDEALAKAELACVREELNQTRGDLQAAQALVEEAEKRGRPPARTR